MKTNSALQLSLKCAVPSQLLLYAASVLSAALLSSPATLVSSAVAAIPAKPAIVAQTAKPARAATAAILAAANTTGYAFGELYLNSPAYPIGTAIPAIPAKPASAAVVGVPAVIAVAAITAVTAPAVAALKGWENAISIVKSATNVVITAELPVSQNVAIVGSSKVVIGEITPSNLQATDWLDAVSATSSTPVNDASIATLEQLFWKYAQDLEHVTTDVIRVVNGVSLPCKRIVVTLYALSGYDPLGTSLQLSKIADANNVGT